MSIEIEKIKPNLTRVIVGDLSIWFSYETPIAFKVYGQPRVVRENVWGPTTGKHLNSIDGGTEKAKARRVSSDEFDRALDALGLGGMTC